MNIYLAKIIERYDSHDGKTSKHTGLREDIFVNPQSAIEYLRFHGYDVKITPDGVRSHWHAIGTRDNGYGITTAKIVTIRLNGIYLDGSCNDGVWLSDCDIKHNDTQR